MGKESEIGAHISVPSVRGDKVLWMCGGHRNENSRQFDSAGLQPKTRGNVEPCQPRIKTALPMSRFESLKSLMKSIDQLVFEKLKKKVKTLNGVSERSDCMLAKYADGGSSCSIKSLKNIANRPPSGKISTGSLFFGCNLRLPPSLSSHLSGFK